MESLAVISDVHGNSWALTAVLRNIEQRGITRVVNLGDCVYGPLDPAGTAGMLIERKFPTVRGNEDRMITEQDSTHGDNPTLSMNREVLAPDHLEWLASLPATLALDPGMFLFHGTPDDDTKYFLRVVGESSVQPTAQSLLADTLTGITAGLFLCGHDHLQATVPVTDETIVVNPGSVGLPAYTDDHPFPHACAAGTPHARYSILYHSSTGWEVDHCRVAYDWDAAADRAETNGRPDWAQWLKTGTATVSGQF